MISTKSVSLMLAGTLLAGAAWQAAQAQTSAPYPPKEGTVYSAHSPETGGCPALDWHVWVGPNNTLSGMVAMEGVKNIWRVAGTMSAERTFHLNGQEQGGAQRTGTVDGQVRTDGSLSATIGNISGASSPCNNKTIYIRWFSNGGSIYEPMTSGGG